MDPERQLRFELNRLLVSHSDMIRGSKILKEKVSRLSSVVDLLVLNSQETENLIETTKDHVSGDVEKLQGLVKRVTMIIAETDVLLQEYHSLLKELVAGVKPI